MLCNGNNHLPGCMCGFGGDTFSGETRRSRFEGWGLVTEKCVSGAGLNVSNDSCRTSKCPVCHAQVYFVRHNGGSAWFDELGPAWPKHPCLTGESRDSLQPHHNTSSKDGVVWAYVEAKHFDDSFVSQRRDERADNEFETGEYAIGVFRLETGELLAEPCPSSISIGDTCLIDMGGTGVSSLSNSMMSVQAKRRPQFNSYDLGVIYTLAFDGISPPFRETLLPVLSMDGQLQLLEMFGQRGRIEKRAFDALMIELEAAIKIPKVPTWAEMHSRIQRAELRHLNALSQLDSLILRRAITQRLSTRWSMEFGKRQTAPTPSSKPVEHLSSWIVRRRTSSLAGQCIMTVYSDNARDVAYLLVKDGVGAPTGRITIDRSSPVRGDWPLVIRDERGGIWLGVDCQVPPVEWRMRADSSPQHGAVVLHGGSFGIFSAVDQDGSIQTRVFCSDGRVIRVPARNVTVWFEPLRDAG